MIDFIANHPVLLIIVWIVSAPIGYLMGRRLDRAAGGTWTQNARLWALFFAIVWGPACILIHAMTFGLLRLMESNWGQREAKW